METATASHHVHPKQKHLNLGKDMTSTIDTSPRVLDFIINHFPIARKQSITEETPLLETGVIDSLGVLDLVSFIEKGFNIHIADDDLTPENFSTIRSISQLILRKLSNDHK